MKKYGLIGKSLAHSWSPAWFADKFEREGITDAEYRLYEMDTVEHLRQWVEENGIDGFNVTIPFKEQVLPFLDRVDDVARLVGAVNCVEVCQGVLVGHNTDAPAFAETLSPLLRPWHTHALVLGTGGASRAVSYVLEGMGIDFLLVSRNPAGRNGVISYQQAEQAISSRLLLVNTTPVGMYPHVGQNPWPNATTLSTTPRPHTASSRRHRPAQQSSMDAPCSTGRPSSAGSSGINEKGGKGAACVTQSAAAAVHHTLHLADGHIAPWGRYLHQIDPGGLVA